MARAHRTSDDVYNARRRFRRQAQRYAKKAEASSGVARSRYESLARSSIEKAISTYSKGSEVQGQVREIAESLGVSTDRVEPLSSRQLKRVEGESLSTLSSTIGPQKGRDVLARELLSIGNIGSRFYGGLVQIWDHDAESRKHPNRAILEFFGTNSIADVLEQLEAQGIDLYAPDDNEDVYKSVQLKLQRFILSTRRLHEAGR